MVKNSFNCLEELNVADQIYQIFNLKKLEDKHNLKKLPFCIKILLENLLRNEDGISVTKKNIENILKWNPHSKDDIEIAFTPSRVILQDFTGVPSIVDLAAMRDAMKNLGGDPSKINPLFPVDLVIDHSVMVDFFGNNNALAQNTEKEFERNQERYQFLRWGQSAFNNFRVVPPGTGIVHQVNLEYLASVVFTQTTATHILAYPDTVVGTDSHTTMIGGLGVLAWGVGGIEAEAAMLGQPITMLLPKVVGFKLIGEMPEATTATDLVLSVTEILRKKGVVGKFVEFFGSGAKSLPLADRATIANMSPEYGATCGFFPIDDETLHFLGLSGRDQKQIDLIRAYSKKVGLFNDHDENSEVEYSEVITLDLSSIEPCVAGPKRPQDKILLKNVKKEFNTMLTNNKKTSNPQSLTLNTKNYTIDNASVVIAAITSCTNTSNPDVMVAAGLLAKNALDRGITRKPWVKTSLAPGSKVVSDYLDKAKLLQPLAEFGFNLVGYGCTTCIGNSGPLLPEVRTAIKSGALEVSAVLSGNRNFEGRIHPEVSNAYLMSPPLVVAYALAGTMNIDFTVDTLGTDSSGNKIYLKDIWPSRKEIQTTVRNAITSEMFTERYSEVFNGDDDWKNLPLTNSVLYAWNDKSTYIRNPSYFINITKHPMPITNIVDANVLVKLGDSITTDHISPAGNIALNSPAGEYLLSCGVQEKDFNSYGSRRGNHEVMIRGTFANIRLKNELAPGTAGSWTIYHPTNEKMSIFAAAEKYKQAQIPLIIIAGKEYGSGSSRDWAAKGPNLLGIKVAIAESYERIHRSNLIGMGILPLQFLEGQNASSLGISGKEHFSFDLSQIKPHSSLSVKVTNNPGITEFNTLVRIDTPKELEYFTHGGILQYVLRSLM
jgi:aconitate hydratase